MCTDAAAIKQLSYICEIFQYLIIDQWYLPFFSSEWYAAAANDADEEDGVILVDILLSSVYGFLLEYHWFLSTQHTSHIMRVITI